MRMQGPRHVQRTRVVMKTKSACLVCNGTGLRKNFFPWFVSMLPPFRWILPLFLPCYFCDGRGSIK
jgi:hypothetical protein